MRGSACGRWPRAAPRRRRRSRRRSRSSPTPLTPYGAPRVLGLLDELRHDGGDVEDGRDQVVGEGRVADLAVLHDCSSSIRARPRPCAVPPSTWPVAPCGLSTRPASCAAAIWTHADEAELHVHLDDGALARRTRTRRAMSPWPSSSKPVVGRWWCVYVRLIGRDELAVAERGLDLAARTEHGAAGHRRLPRRGGGAGGADARSSTARRRRPRRRARCGRSARAPCRGPGRTRPRRCGCSRPGRPATGGASPSPPTRRRSPRCRRCSCSRPRSRRRASATRRG